jgi:hypothetical protein
MSTQKQVPVRIDMQEVNREAIGLGHSQRMLLEALSRAIVTKVLNAQEAKGIGEKLKQRPVSDALQIEKRDDASPPSEGMAP